MMAGHREIVVELPTPSGTVRIGPVMPSPIIQFPPMPEFSEEEIAELQAAADTNDRTPIAGALVRRVFHAIQANTRVLATISEELERTQARNEELVGTLREVEQERQEAVLSAEEAREERDRLQNTLDRQVNEIYEASQTAQGNLREALAQEARTSESLRGERDEARAALGRARDAVREAGKALAPVLSSEYAEQAATGWGQAARDAAESMLPDEEKTDDRGPVPPGLLHPATGVPRHIHIGPDRRGVCYVDQPCQFADGEGE